MATSSSPLTECIICLDEDVDKGRACGFCGKFICQTCLPNLVEIDEEGEIDEQNGDLRCPNCRNSLVEGDLHRRRSNILAAVPELPKQLVSDIVTLEDLMSRCMQLCASEESGVEFYNVPASVVTQAITSDEQYCAMLERLLPSTRHARALRRTLRSNPFDRANVSALCREYLKLLTSSAGLTQSEARRIFEVVAQLSLGVEANGATDRYAAAWSTSSVATSRKSGLRVGV